MTDCRICGCDHDKEIHRAVERTRSRLRAEIKRRLTPVSLEKKKPGVRQKYAPPVINRGFTEGPTTRFYARGSRSSGMTVGM